MANVNLGAPSDEELKLRKLKSLSGVDVPQDFLCPLTMEIFKDPVITADGQTYEKDAIETWFASGHQTSPLTNARLPSLAVIPNFALKKLI
mmetsp:Transcript_20033/g.14739  ORF Transcript_20033/g.14739 Transcript_20033/m.14739 type:complete len:91 (+) Transcript_20033:1026-1298(+)